METIALQQHNLRGDFMDTRFAYVCGSYYAPTHASVFVESLADKHGVFLLESDQTEENLSGEQIKCTYLASMNRVEEEIWFFFSEDYLRDVPMNRTTFRGDSARGIIVAFNWFEYHAYPKVMRDVMHSFQFAWCEALPVGILVDVSAPREALQTRQSNGINITSSSRLLSEVERETFVRPATRAVDEFIKSHAWICPYQIVSLDHRRALWDGVTRLLSKFDD
jgi:hypothetical protein